jgi:hypothetical protein
MEPNGFAISTSPRTLWFSRSRVKLPLLTHMRCQSLVDRTPLLAQEETFVDLTAPVRALPAYLHNYSQGCHSRSASTPSASNLLVRGLLLAYARACRNEPSRPLAEHFARFRGRASPNPFGPSPSLRHLSSNSLRHNRSSASARMKGARRAWLLRARCIRLPPPLRRRCCVAYQIRAALLLS